MDNIYLHAMMHGELNVKKPTTKLEVALEREIEKQIANSAILDNPEDKLMTPEARLAKMREELREALQLSEPFQYAESALRFVMEEGRHYLTEEAYTSLLENISQCADHMERYDPKASSHENFKQVLGITDFTVDSMVKIAQESFAAEQIPSALAIFIFLSLLLPENLDFTYRAGIAAHKKEDFDLAKRLYQGAIVLDPNLIRARLFLIDCYLKLGLTGEAAEECAATKLVCETTNAEDYVRALLSKMEERIPRR